MSRASWRLGAEQPSPSQEHAETLESSLIALAARQQRVAEEQLSALEERAMQAEAMSRSVGAYVTVAAAREREHEGGAQGPAWKVTRQALSRAERAEAREAAATRKMRHCVLRAKEAEQRACVAEALAADYEACISPCLQRSDVANLAYINDLTPRCDL